MAFEPSGDDYLLNALIARLFEEKRDVVLLASGRLITDKENRIKLALAAYYLRRKNDHMTLETR